MPLACAAGVTSRTLGGRHSPTENWPTRNTSLPTCAVSPQTPRILLSNTERPSNAVLLLSKTLAWDFALNHHKILRLLQHQDKWTKHEQWSHRRIRTSNSTLCLVGHRRDSGCSPEDKPSALHRAARKRRSRALASQEPFLSLAQVTWGPNTLQKDNP